MKPTTKPAVSPRTATSRAAAAPPRTGPAVVVGEVSPLARVAGGVAVAGVLVLLVAPGFDLATADGRGLGPDANAFDWLARLPLLVLGAAGVLCLLGRLPRLGLAVLLSAGTGAAGLLLHGLYLLDGDQRSSQDLPLGIGASFRYEAAAGLWLGALGVALLVAAAVLAAVAWSRTVMEDDGGFDELRPRFAVAGLFVGTLAALAIGMAPTESTVAGAAPPAVFERSGLALLGGVTLAVAVLVWAVVAATLRPRLATVGAYAGLAALLAADGLSTALLVVRSPALDASAGLIGELLAAAAFAGLAVAAWRVPAPPGPVE